VVVQGDEAEGEEASMFVVVEGLLTGEKTVCLFEPFIYKAIFFAKTGSGQT
jgi:hypothetical protein